MLGKSALRTAGLPRSNDTRLLLVGVAAFLALVVYLAVAFVNTHPTEFATAPGLSSKVAPWSPFASNLFPIPLRKGRGFAVRVTPLARGSATAGNYGAVVQTLVPNPTAGRRYVFGLWLRGARPGRIAVELNEFRPGAARYPVQTTVPATARWHHFTFSLRVKGVWLGLAIVLSRPDRGHRTWFAVRNLT